MLIAGMEKTDGKCIVVIIVIVAELNEEYLLHRKYFVASKQPLLTGG